MQILQKRTMICDWCLQKPAVYAVRIMSKKIFKGVPVEYEGDYYYCHNEHAYYADEKMLSRNDIAMKDAYRSKMGFLTSNEIASIRKKYGISSEKLSLLLGWDAKTIGEYEEHRVQDAAHDEILRKFAAGPEDFLSRRSAIEKSE